MNVTAQPGLREIGYYMVGISKLPGFDRVIKLSSNESALGASPKALEAAAQAIAHSHLYPEVDTECLEEAIAARFSLDAGRMAFGPGSDELLTRIVNAYAGPGDEVVHSKNAYMQFPIYAKLAGATPVAAADEDLHYSVDALLACVTERTKIVIVANPDNPSGTHLSGAELRRLHAGLSPGTLLLIDAAYEEYALEADYESGTKLVEQFDNVVVTRTFSKIFGLAGLRLGWCYGSREMADLLTKIGPSFPVNAAAQAAGVAAIEDRAHFDRVLAHNAKCIKDFSQALNDMGLKAYPSQTNFVLVAFPDGLGVSTEAVDGHLKANGIIPRRFAVPDFADKLRFTMGLEWEMEKTAEVLGDFLRR
ncbi:MAG: histidinol-phosphate transaminase [Pseudomonadota bacterium]